ncbi:melanocyte-stimulating hormone receptor-like [Ostrea edulis]|uniref:melanocyte-stimulating hormone receptor-like n=1 Tax=Ostrea edulis TaxID=37623 RepID=UPI0024AEF362|nr:melanocyte-stimulating hormone receptor-like [Ostrea edulis]
MSNTTNSLFYESSTNTHRWTEHLDILRETNVSNSSSSPLDEDSFQDLSSFLEEFLSSSEKDLPIDDPGTRIVGTLLFSFGMVGNLITMVVIVVMKRLHSPTYVTIACLALSNCMASSIRYTRFLFYVFQYSFQDYLRLRVLEIFSFLFLHSANFHIVLLSYIRYVFIVKPLKSLEITCTKVFKLSVIIWVFSLIISGVYGVRHVLYTTDMISFDLANKTEIGFALYVVGVPFVLVSCFHIRKICHLLNKPKRKEGCRVKATHSMSIMFSIIIMVYLLTTVYPMLHTVLLFRCKYCNDLFNFFLLVNNSINPYIYFAFSPPVKKLLSRLRNCVRDG